MDSTRRSVLALIGLAPLIAKAKPVVAAEPIEVSLVESPAMAPFIPVGRLIRDTSELLQEEISMLFATGEVPGVCKAVGWKPCEGPGTPVVPQTFMVENIQAEHIARIDRVGPLEMSDQEEWSSYD